MLKQKSLHIQSSRSVVKNSRGASEPFQTSMMVLFEKTVNGFHPLSIFTIRSILDV